LKFIIQRFVPIEPEGAKVIYPNGTIIGKNTPIEIEVKGNVGEEKKPPETE